MEASNDNYLEHSSEGESISFTTTPPSIANGRESTNNSSNLLDSIRICLPGGCNIRCLYCFTEGGNKKGTLEYSYVADLISEAKKLGAKTIYIIGSGEPLFYKRIFDLLKLIDENDMYCLLFTNGTLVDEDTAKRLFQHNVSIITKLNSFDEDVQNNLIGTNKYEQLQQGLTNLIAAGFNKSVPSRLGIDTIICKQNIAEIPAIFEYCRENNIIPMMEPLSIKGWATQNDLSPTKSQIEDVIKKVLSLDRKKYGFDWDPTKAHIATAGQCYDKSCFVDENGLIYPTSASESSAGSFFDNNLKEVLESPLFEEIRKNDKHFTKNF